MVLKRIFAGAMHGQINYIYIGYLSNNTSRSRVGTQPLASCLGPTTAVAISVNQLHYHKGYIAFVQQLHYQLIKLSDITLCFLPSCFLNLFVHALLLKVVPSLVSRSQANQQFNQRFGNSEREAKCACAHQLTLIN